VLHSLVENSKKILQTFKPQFTFDFDINRISKSYCCLHNYCF